MLAVVRAKINDHDVRLEIQRVGVGRTPDVGKIAAMQQRRGTHAKVAHVVICPQPLTELQQDRVLRPFVLCSLVFLLVSPSGSTPEYGRFSTARAATHITAALAENLPHRSREHEFSAGRLGFFCKKSSFAHVMSVFINLRNWCSPVKQKNVL